MEKLLPLWRKGFGHGFEPGLTPQALESASFITTPPWRSLWRQGRLGKRGSQEEKILMDAQVWMSGEEIELDHVLSGSCPGSRHFPSVQDAPLSWGRRQPSALPSCRRDQQLHVPGSQELGAHPAQPALGTGNEQGKYHLQPREKLHPKTSVSCLVL